MREHVKILGILNIILGCLGALAGLCVLLVFGGIAGVAGASASDYDAAAAVSIVTIIGLCVAVLIFVLALPSIIGGWGLIRFKGWARVLMIVISVLELFHIPLGTALGVYGIWVLMSDETRQLFESGGQGPSVPPPVPYPVRPA